MYSCTVALRKSLYPVEAMLKAAYAFIGENYIHMDESEDTWQVSISPKTPGVDPAIAVKEFENELLSQTVRLSVYQRTHTIRELILARALTSTMVDTASNEPAAEEPEEDISDEELEYILTDWFDQNEE